MAVPHEISLLPKEDFERKPLGIFLIWALSVGRWVVVITELIVISAFLSRFYLDRRIADLHDEIFQKQAIVKALADFESDFRFLQFRLETIKQINRLATPNQIINEIVSNVPSDVTLSGLKYEEGNVEIEAVSFSQYGIDVFLNQLSLSKNLDKVRLAEVTKEKDKTEIVFKITANYQEVKADAP